MPGITECTMAEIKYLSNTAIETGNGNHLGKIQFKFQRFMDHHLGEGDSFNS